MRRRDRESNADSDPHGLLFDPSDEHDPPGSRPSPRPAPSMTPGHDPLEHPSRRETRSRAAARARKRRGRRLAVVISVLLVAAVAVAVWFVVLPVYHYFSPDNYSGSGTGSVVVTVNPNDDATQIGQTLHERGVVASVRSFTDAATKNTASESIQPGSYRLHSHMSAVSALRLLLNPSSRVRSDVVVPEGATSLDVEKRLVAKPCGANAADDAICGPGLPAAAVAKALKNAASLGLPTDYTADGKAPSSVEGFLFPATYTFSAKTAPSDALQQMITKFTDETRSSDFATAAQTEHLTPYQALTIASIAQAEAKFPADFARVARVILNRIAANKPLQIDATSAYAAKLKGLDPAKVIYSEVSGPFNTYDHTGLPPTPISNPGTEAMSGAVHPAAGNWLFYVNADAAGHLFFTNSETAFEKARARCVANNWGCG